VANSPLTNLSRLLIILLCAGLTSAVRAQVNSACADPGHCSNTNTDTNIFYPTSPLNYPLASDQYAVEYKLGTGGWTNVPVHISYYGGTLASPFNIASGYLSNKTSMSFVSIPAFAGATVSLRVTNLNSGFTAADNVSVRPSTKPVTVSVGGNGVATLTTTTASNFNGDQFLLWWSDGTNGGNIQSLVFFLDPPYPAPAGPGVKTITTNTALTNLTNIDTLIFQGTFELVPGGYGDYYVPTNITKIYLAPDAWVQGKLHFIYSGGVHKQICGPGVLDGSKFCYALRTCPGDPGDNSLTFDNSTNRSTPDTYSLDGIIITDHNHAMADKLVNGSVNNVKGIGWNSINGGFRLGDNTTVSNVFLLCGDDSLMMWGSNVIVRNATVWQTYNGGVVNLGWDTNSPGDGCLIDGLYVVKSDWHSPTNPPNFSKSELDGQNNAVIASLMVPGTMFGTVNPPLFRNILVEDPPNVLLSLKILFPECADPDNPRFGNCALADLTSPSVLNLNIENLCTPAAVQKNSIGFYTAKPGFTYEFPAGVTNTLTNYTFNGSMNIGLTNVIIQSADGTVNPLTGANAATVANLITNGTNISLSYGFNPDPCLSCLPQLAITSSLTNAILSWPTNFPAFNLEFATNLASPAVWQTNPTTPAVIGGQNVVTNPISAKRQFFRLVQ
jgi:hypothetical protein